MKISELIEALREFDQELEIFINPDDEHGPCSDFYLRKEDNTGQWPDDYNMPEKSWVEFKL